MDGDVEALTAHLVAGERPLVLAADDAGGGSAIRGAQADENARLPGFSRKLAEKIMLELQDGAEGKGGTPREGDMSSSVHNGAEILDAHHDSNTGSDVETR